MADLDFTPEETNLALYRGKGGSFTMVFKDADGDPMVLPTTGWAAQVRLKPTITAELLMSFTVDGSSADEGSVVVSWTGADVAAVTAKRGYWDVDCADADDVYTNGTVTFEGEVTDS
jgi:hypothetical protein